MRRTGGILVILLVASVALAPAAGAKRKHKTKPKATTATATTLTPTTTTSAAVLSALAWCQAHPGDQIGVPRSALATASTTAKCVVTYSVHGDLAPGSPPNTALVASLTFPFQAADVDGTSSGVGTAGLASCTDPANVDAMKTVAASVPADAVSLKADAALVGTTVPELVCLRSVLLPIRSPSTTAPGTPPLLYEVFGSGSALITYSNQGFGQQQVTATLPWSVQPQNPSTSVIVAQLQGSGTITCRITKSGRVATENTSSGQYAVVSCSA
jgi:hypothetical protein